MHQAIIGILAGCAAFVVMADALRIPHIRTSKALRNLSRRQARKTSSLELWLKDFAIWVSGIIRMNVYKRLQMVSDLKTADIDITPELHIANAAIKSGVCAVFAIPAFFIFPLVVPLIIALALTLYFKETNGIQEKIKKKRAAIEYELPRMVFTIEKTLFHNRDVLAILDAYRDGANTELKQELSITVADMRSGNYELALTRLEARVGSSMLSDVTRGLGSILHGDDTSAYWPSLSVKFADIQRQMLKHLAQKVPAKVRRLSMVVLFCLMAVYMVVIATEIMSSLGAVFG